MLLAAHTLADATVSALSRIAATHVCLVTYAELARYRGTDAVVIGAAAEPEIPPAAALELISSACDYVPLELEEDTLPEGADSHGGRALDRSMRHNQPRVFKPP